MGHGPPVNTADQDQYEIIQKYAEFKIYDNLRIVKTPFKIAKIVNYNQRW